MKDPFQGADWCRPVHSTPKFSVMSGINVNFPNVMAPFDLQNQSISSIAIAQEIREIASSCTEVDIYGFCTRNGAIR